MGAATRRPSGADSGEGTEPATWPRDPRSDRVAVRQRRGQGGALLRESGPDPRAAHEPDAVRGQARGRAARSSATSTICQRLSAAGPFTGTPKCLASGARTSRAGRSMGRCPAPTSPIGRSPTTSSSRSTTRLRHASAFRATSTGCRRARLPRRRGATSSGCRRTRRCSPEPCSPRARADAVITPIRSRWLSTPSLTTACLPATPAASAPASAVRSTRAAAPRSHSCTRRFCVARSCAPAAPSTAST